MRIYINTETLQYPVYEADIRALFPNTSFSVPFMAPERFAAVKATPQQITGVDKNLVESAPEFVNGEWRQVWTEVPALAEEVTARLADGMDRVRDTRNKILKETDWIVSISDSPMSAEKIAEWKAYRQALRDLPANIQDTYQVEWPVQPK